MNKVLWLGGGIVSLALLCWLINEIDLFLRFRCKHVAKDVVIVKKIQVTEKKNKTPEILRELVQSCRQCRKVLRVVYISEEQWKNAQQSN